MQLKDLQYVSCNRVAPDQVLRQGDVVLCMANGSRDLVGKSARFVDVDDGAQYTFGAFMGCFRPDPAAADPLYAFYLFHTEAYRRHIDILLAGSSINNLTPSNVDGFVVEVPAQRGEQAAVAEVIADMDSELDALVARLAKTRQLKQGMMQVLLTGAIRLT